MNAHITLVFRLVKATEVTARQNNRVGFRLTERGGCIQ